MGLPCNHDKPRPCEYLDLTFQNNVGKTHQEFPLLQGRHRSSRSWGVGEYRLQFPRWIIRPGIEFLQ